MKVRGLVLDRSRDLPLNRQLEAAFRNAILSGELEAGQRILSTRELQTHLGLSRNTITNALGQLQAEGYLVTVPGSGTFVADIGRLPESQRFAQGRDEPEKLWPGAAPYAAVRALADNLDLAVPFRPGIPDLNAFPRERFRRGLSPSLWNPKLLDYPDPQGQYELRESIAKRLHQTRGIVCNADQVLVTVAAQAAFALIARLLVEKHDVVAVEEPGYPAFRAPLLARGARLFAVPVDDAGMDVRRLNGSDAKLVHTTPSHQYPTGAVLSLERRLALLEWAKSHDAWIIEDDYDSEFNYTGRPQPALHSLDAEHRVFYVGTFSKSLAPAVRIAYLVLPRSIRSSFIAAQQVEGGQPSPIVQLALAEFIESGHFGRHITKMRKVYDQRRRFVNAEFTHLSGSGLEVCDSLAGLHFIVKLPAEISDVEYSARALERGIVVPPLSSYFYGRPTLNGIVVGYAPADTKAASGALAVLATLLGRK